MTVRNCYRIRWPLLFCGWLALTLAGLSAAALAAPAAEDEPTKPVQPKEDNKELLSALARFKDQDPDGALKILRVAAGQQQDLSPPHVILARWYLQTNQAKAARVSLERAVMEQPTDPESYVAISELAIQEGRVTEAELALEKATALLEEFTKSPRRKEALVPRVHANLAAVWLWREDWSRAEAHLMDWLKCDPNNVTAHQQLGRVLFAEGKPAAALRQFQLAASADPNALKADIMMGRLYEQAGERTKAADSMDSAVRAAPMDLKTRLAVSQWALETGQFASAQEHAQAALNIDPNALEAKYLRGMVALYQRDFPVAENYFQAVLAQTPSNLAASNNLALALVYQPDENKQRRALEYAQMNVRQYPREAGVYSTLGWILYQLGRRDEAEQALRTAASSGTVSSDAAYYWGRINVDHDRKADARRILERALQTSGLFMFRQEAEDLLKQLADPGTESERP